MADRYRVLNGNWDLANSWSTTSGGVGGASVPTSSDDVYFDSNTPIGTHILNVDSYGNNYDFTGFTGTLTYKLGTNRIMYIYGNFTLSSSMTFLFNRAWALYGGAGVTQEIRMNGNSLGTAYLYKLVGGSTIKLMDKLTFNISSTSTTIGGIWQTTGTFDANGQDVEFTGENNALRTNITFYNLIKSGIGQLIVYRSNTITIDNSIQVNGNSTTKQIIRSDLAGTQATLHNNTGSTIILSNCDIKDINFTGDGWIADKTCIDSGNNTGITFGYSAVSKLFAYDLENSSTNVYTTINVSVVGTGLDKLVFYIGEYNGVSTTYSEVTLIGTTTSRTGSITLSGNNYRGINWKAEADGGTVVISKLSVRY